MRRQLCHDGFCLCSVLGGRAWQGAEGWRAVSMTGSEFLPEGVGGDAAGMQVVRKWSACGCSGGQGGEGWRPGSPMVAAEAAQAGRRPPDRG